MLTTREAAVQPKWVGGRRAEGKEGARGYWAASTPLRNSVWEEFAPFSALWGCQGDMDPTAGDWPWGGKGEAAAQPSSHVGPRRVHPSGILSGLRPRS